jgi:hypothetical protein
MAVSLVLDPLFAGGTSKLFRKEFKNTMETKKFEYFIGNKLFQNLIWSSPLDHIKYCNCETIKLH